MQLVVTESGVALCRPSVVDSQVCSKFYAVIWYCFQISIPTARGVVKGGRHQDVVCTCDMQFPFNPKSLLL